MIETPQLPSLTFASSDRPSLKLRMFNDADDHEYLVTLNQLLAEAVTDTATSGFYDIQHFTSGVPGSSGVVLAFVAPRALTLPINFSGSRVKAKTAATASTVFDIQKNGVSIGSMTFAIAGTVPTFSVVASASLAIGDVLEIIAPGSADATLASLRLSIVAARA